MDNKLLGLKNEVSQTVATKQKKGMVGRQINDALLQEVESMFDYLRKEIFMLRQNNGELKSHLRLVDEENGSLRHVLRRPKRQQLQVDCKCQT
jgi:hypothetical protein